jgi:hypothetical protein
MASPAMLFGAAPMFPAPLHVVRRVEDPLSRTDVTLDEYYAGNRIVSARGAHVSVMDYDKQEMTEIDHAAHSYSVTRFDEMAAVIELQPRLKGPVANPASTLQSAGKASSAWTRHALGRGRTPAGIAVERFDAADGNGEQSCKVEISIDRKVLLSREAVEALIGAAYPRKRKPLQDEILRAAGGGGDPRLATQSTDETATAYGLPAELKTTYGTGTAAVTVTISILSVERRAPPPALLLIDPGATQVESRTTKLKRGLETIDRLPGESEH